MISIRELFQGDSRTVKANKNILASASIKVADTLVYLLLVPMTLGYLNAYEYGIWLTLNSILAWINSFDIGLGNGLRNKLAMALAEGNNEKARTYVSTTFFMLLMLISVVYSILFWVVNIVDWYSLLNVSSNTVGNLIEVIQVSLFFFCVNFVLKFIGNVYQGLQLPSINYLFSFSGHLLSLIIIFAFTKLVVPGTLFWVAAIYSAAPPVVYLVSYPITFRVLYPYLAPSFKYFNKLYLRDLLSLSIVFFLLQIASIVLFAMSNLVISNLFGPEQVTPYNIAYRYYSLVPMLFNMVITPMWSATTDAYTNNDIQWIKKCNKKMLKLLVLFGLILVLMTLFSELVYRIWIGDMVEIPFAVSAIMAVYIMVLIWSTSFSFFLNGMGKLKLQLILTVLAALLFYPVCYILGTEFGVTGILIGMTVVIIPGAIVNSIQFVKVTAGKATGLWDK